MILLAAGETVQDILEYALGFANGAWSLLRDILMLNPERSNSTVWSLVTSTHGYMVKVALPLVMTCFLLGMFKTEYSFIETKRWEPLLVSILRFFFAEFMLVHGLSIVTDLMRLGIGLVDKIFNINQWQADPFTMPTYLSACIGNLKFFKHPIQTSLTLILSVVGTLVILSTMIGIIITVYARFFRLFVAIIMAPLPLATFASDTTQGIGISFLRSILTICLEPVLAAIACMIFLVLQSSDLLPTIQLSGNVVTTTERAYDQLAEQLSGYSQQDIDRAVSIHDPYILSNDYAADPDLRQKHSERYGMDAKDAQTIVKYYQAFESAVSDIGYQKVLLMWMVPIIFHLLILASFIKGLDQMAGRLLGLG